MTLLLVALFLVAVWLAWLTPHRQPQVGVWFTSWSADERPGWTFRSGIPRNQVRLHGAEGCLAGQCRPWTARRVPQTDADLTHVHPQEAAPVQFCFRGTCHHCRTLDRVAGSAWEGTYECDGAVYHATMYSFLK